GLAPAARNRGEPQAHPFENTSDIVHSLSTPRQLMTTPRDGSRPSPGFLLCPMLDWLVALHRGRTGGQIGATMDRERGPADDQRPQEAIRRLYSPFTARSPDESAPARGANVRRIRRGHAHPERGVPVGAWRAHSRCVAFHTRAGAQSASSGSGAGRLPRPWRDTSGWRAKPG